jgi:hypothetical protein
MVFRPRTMQSKLNRYQDEVTINTTAQDVSRHMRG